MEKVKRCPFCGHRLNAKGYCTNKNCSDFVRKEITESEEKKNAV